MSGPRRPVTELILLMLAGAASFVIVFSAVAVIISIFVNPHLDLVGAARALGGIVNTVVGALIGYLVGAKTTKPPEDK